MEGVKELFNTNFLGPVCLIKEVLSEMRKRKSSAIINISSLGALTCNGGSGYYSASKSALEKMSISLRDEVEPLEIKGGSDAGWLRLPAPLPGGHCRSGVHPGQESCRLRNPRADHQLLQFAGIYGAADFEGLRR